MIIDELQRKNLIQPPKWLKDNTQFLTVMGSEAYRVNQDSSDRDVYGFCIPPKDSVFPHLAGHILGFGHQPEPFGNWQQHHIQDKDAYNGKGCEWDFDVFGIVKYFQLAMENNPNILDSLCVPLECILHNTLVGQMVRDNRKLFLHKGSYFKFKGYGFSMLSKIREKTHKGLAELKDFERDFGISHDTLFAEVETELNNRKNDLYGGSVDLCTLDTRELEEYHKLFKVAIEATPHRLEKRKPMEYDYKFAMHLVRLMGECEQILVECDLDITRNAEQLKSIRRGEWKLEDVQKYFYEKEKTLESLYASSKLQNKPDEPAIRTLLMNCLEHHYGSLEACVRVIGKEEQILKQIKELVERY